MGEGGPGGNITGDGVCREVFLQVQNSLCPHRRPLLARRRTIGFPADRAERVNSRSKAHLLASGQLPSHCAWKSCEQGPLRHLATALSIETFHKLFTDLQSRTSAADKDSGTIMKKKILIVDDDPVMSFVCQRLLTKHDYETELAPDGEKGLERLQAFRPDAVLLDLMMPKVSGTAFLQQLRAQEAFRGLPVIVLTNAAVPALIEQAASAGATRILDKSKFNPVAVIELLRAVLHNGPPAAINVMSHGEPWKG